MGYTNAIRSVQSDPSLQGHALAEKPACDHKMGILLSKLHFKRNACANTSSGSN